MASNKNAKRQRPPHECAAQAAHTNRNKLRQAKRRVMRRAHWVTIGTKKNGAKVKGAVTS